MQIDDQTAEHIERLAALCPDLEVENLVVGSDPRHHMKIAVCGAHHGLAEPPSVDP